MQPFSIIVFWSTMHHHGVAIDLWDLKALQVISWMEEMISDDNPLRPQAHKPGHGVNEDHQDVGRVIALLSKNIYPKP